MFLVEWVSYPAANLFFCHYSKNRNTLDYRRLDYSRFERSTDSYS